MSNLFRVNVQTPQFLLKDRDLFNPVILETNNIKGLIDLKTGKAPDVADALVSNSCNSYEMYSIIKPSVEGTPSATIIDNYLSRGVHLYRISGLLIEIGSNHQYKLNGVKGFFQFSNSTNEEIEFI